MSLDAGNGVRIDFKRSYLKLIDSRKTYGEFLCKKELLRIAKNPFRVLDLPINSTENEIVKKTESIKKKIRLGADVNSIFGFHLLIDIQVNESDAQKAFGQLMNPKTRVRARLFWFSDYNKSFIESFTKGLVEIERYEKILFEAISERHKRNVSELYEVALFSLILLVLDDHFFMKQNIWIDTYNLFEYLIGNDRLWEYYHNLEEDGAFLKPLGSEVNSLKKGALLLLLEPVELLMERHLGEDDICSMVRCIEVLNKLDIDEETKEEVLNKLYHFIEDQIKTICLDLKEVLGSKIFRDDEHIAENINTCDLILALFESKVMLKYNRFFASNKQVDKSILKRIISYILDFKVALGKSLTWGNDFFRAADLLQDARDLTEDAFDRERIDDVLSGIKPVGQYYEQTATRKEESNHYLGDYKDGQYDGQGIYIWASGDKYMGEWRNGKKQGYGVYSWPSGHKYTGKWKDGKIHGYGEISYSSGSIYTGEWEDGAEHGHGECYYSDGSIYTGEWSYGERSGQGTYSETNGTVLPQISL